MQGTVRGARRRGGGGQSYRKRWEDDFREWTGLDSPSHRGLWKTDRGGGSQLLARSSVVPLPTILWVKEQLDSYSNSQLPKSSLWYLMAGSWRKTVAVQFTSVYFSSRWYLCALESPYKIMRSIHPVSQEFHQCSHVGLIDSGKTVRRSADRSHGRFPAERCLDDLQPSSCPHNWV